MTLQHDPAVLADPTRRALLAALRDADEPLGVADLAAGLGLHRNSVRDQLRRLARAGLVRITHAAPAGRGRPGLRYVAVPEPEDVYRVLAAALVDQIAASPGGAGTAEAAGERWGRAAAASATGPATASASGPSDAGEAAALDTVVGLLADAGFAPEPVLPGADEIRLRECPFLPIDHDRLAVVCGVHLGFIRGALREVGSPLDAVAIEPFVRPDLCVARIGRPHHA
jgi:predicted ArsR family transcriptional regulator